MLKSFQLPLSGTPLPLSLVYDTYVRQVLTDGPNAYWRLNEASGVVARDSTGKGRVGTYVNTPTLGVSGPRAGATAVSFDQPSTQRVDVADDATLRTPAFSLEGWFYQTAFDGDFEMLASKTALTGAWNDGYGIYSIGQQIWFWVNNYSDPGRSGGGPLFALNAWHHVVGTFDGSTVRCYLDGVLIGTPLAGVVLVHSTQPFRIAAEGGLNPSYYWQDRLADIAYYPLVLTPTQIAAHSAAGRVGFSLPALDIPYRQLLLHTSGAPAYVGTSAAVGPANGLALAVDVAATSLGPYDTGPLKLSDIWAVGAGATLTILGVPH